MTPVLDSLYTLSIETANYGRTAPFYCQMGPTDFAALREELKQWSFGPSQPALGFSVLKIHSPGGEMQIQVNPMVKRGDAYLVPFGADRTVFHAKMPKEKVPADFCLWDLK